MRFWLKIYKGIYVKYFFKGSRKSVKFTTIFFVHDWTDQKGHNSMLRRLKIFYSLGLNNQADNFNFFQ